ncbi:adenine deaminase C-terminal domain-containing protein [Paenibacillus sp. VCA1]|uniref:adenine deaminase C-terminal domain-containing protein n=1 Tax=Paenibacillus sp. VCA1 TaxID=3039148 RepID=UPI002871007C|nr:adenine deaminase C-terminal domain-containing protein [Paenibacillus sp. VCA1]MDR9856321.1 adenine deaminase C-terminal domain-containing protein [Paenibacillus sp. VCA1]
MQPDLLLLKPKVYNSYFKQWTETNVAVKDGKFMYIGPRGEESFQAGRVIDASGLYMVPGFIDIHLHIESTMVTPGSFSQGLLRNGVTTIVPEPHEMANVFGLDGVLEMINASRDCEVDMFYAIPSSVPATSLETSGGSIEIEDMEALLATGDVICLGEIMNYVDIITDPDCKTNRILKHMKEHHPELVIEGHVPKLLDLDLQRVIFAGVDSDHTHQTVEGLKARIGAGMFIEIQEKSMTPEIMDYLIKHDVSEHFCFVTDDVMADSFKARGHLNHIVRKAIGMGMAPEKAIYAATSSPSRRMRLYDRGTIAPGKTADFQLISSLSDLKLEAVYKNGKEAYTAAAPSQPKTAGYRFPDHFYRSVQLNELSEADFAAKVDVEDGTYLCRVMTVQDGSTFTQESRVELQAADGCLQWEGSGLGMIATFERYGKHGGKAFGLIGGDTIQKGAVATTYSHDNHNLLVVGHNVKDMLLAANTVIRQQGGFCVVSDGEVTANMHLPVGGILTEEPLESAAESVKRLREAMQALGYKHYNPIMSIATHSLPVSPYLKITDRGLIDVNAGQVVPLIIEKR